MDPLPRAPDAVADETGAPRFGTFAGRLRDVSLSGFGPRSNLARALSGERRWLRVWVGSPSLVVSGGLTLQGPLAQVELSVFDRRERRFLAHRSIWLPSRLADLDDGGGEARATARRLRSRLLLEASTHAGRFQASLGRGLEAALVLRTERAPEPVSAIEGCGGRLLATQKSFCIPADGEVRVGPCTYRLSNAMATLDYSHGLLGSSVGWRRVLACGRLPSGPQIGLNLADCWQAGEGGENAVWCDGEPLSLDRAALQCEAGDPDAPWRVSTEDGRLQLRFVPEGRVSEQFDVFLAMRRRVRLLGAFYGTVRLGHREQPIAGLPGMAELLEARWG